METLTGTARSIGLRHVAHLALVALAACGGENEPDPPGPPAPGRVIVLAAGDSSTRTIASGFADTVVTFRYTPATRTEVAVFMKVDRGVLDLRMTVDSTITWSFPVSPSTRSLLGIRTDRFVIPAGSHLDIRASRAVQSTGSVTFRLLVYPVNRAPEHAAAAYRLGDVILGEKLETSADIDEFTVAGTSGDDWAAYLEAPGPVDDFGNAQSILHVVRPTGDVVPGLEVRANGDVLEDRGSSGTLIETATHTVRIFGDPWVEGDAQAYKFMVQKVNRAPEVEREVNAPGDSLIEAIDYIGDIDIFTITGAPGQRVNVFIAADSSRSGALLLDLVGPDAPYVDGGLGYNLSSWSTGRFALPASGKVQLRARTSSNLRETRNGYKIYVYPVNPAPEHAAVTFAAGDSVLTEDIERQGDLDEFILTVPTAGLMNFVISRPALTLPGTIQFQRLAPDSTVIQTFNIGGTDTLHGSGRLQVPAGTYRVRMDWLTQASPFWGSGPAVGPYRLFAYRISLAPETAPSSLTLGVPVTDRMEPFGDVDTMNFAGVAGDVVQLSLTVPGNPAGSVIGVFMEVPNPQVGYPMTVGGSANAVAPPLEIPETATYKVTVDADGGGEYVTGKRGPYTLRIDRIPAAPESAPATLTVPGSITEPFTPYDVDDFLVSGPPNGEVSIVLSHTLPNMTICATVLAANAPTRIGGALSIGYPFGSGVVPLGPTGQVRIRMMAPGNYGSSGCPGDVTPRTAGGIAVPSYHLDIYRVNRAPENVAGAVAVGDTIRGESINHPGDLDEFTFAGTAGQRLTAAMREIYPGPDPIGRTRFEVVAPGGAVIVPQFYPGGAGFWVNAPQVTLPTTGTYRIRFMTDNNREGTSSYEFTVGN